MKKKVVLITVIGLTAAILTVGLSLSIYALTVIFGTTTLKVNPKVTYQTMEGFGGSSAWYYQAFGNLDDEIVTEGVEKLYGESGLKLNIFRYNIGGGGRVEKDGQSLGVDGQPFSWYDDPMRGEESYFIADKFDTNTKDYSVFSKVENYDFTEETGIDKGVLEMLKRALEVGNIQKIVFFANSPHYLMTKNGKTHGANPYEENLKPECFEAFSEYLCLITTELYNKYVKPQYPDVEVLISPVNEPQWKWGGEDKSQGGEEVGQEGCHYEPATLGKFYDAFSKTLKKYNEKNETEFKMDIFESGNYKLSTEKKVKFREYMNEFQKYDYFEELDSISLHSYGVDESVPHRNRFKKYMDKNFPALKISMSEYCTMVWGIDYGIDMGLSAGKVMLRDFKYIDATDWCYWLALAHEGYESGLVYWMDDENNQPYLDCTKRYYIVGQFTKFVTPESVRIDTSYSDTLGWNGVESVAFRRPDGKTVLIVLNDSKYSHKVKLQGLGGKATVTYTNEKANWETAEVTVDGSVEVTPKSVTTYVFDQE